MRCLLVFLLALCSLQSFSQSPCRKNSSLYWFDTKYHPLYFTEKLGRHPQFPFLQQINGITTAALFIQSINNPANQQKYAREFKAFDLLLRNSGFANGYKDLSVANTENTFVNRKTIGNLGFYDKVKDKIEYIYVKLNPAGEPAPGVAAWRLTNAGGCSFFILHTCGNAFYPLPGQDAPAPAPAAVAEPAAPSAGRGGDCCRTVTVEAKIPPVELKNDSIDRPLHIKIGFYQGRVTSSQKGSDTTFTVLYHVDTVKSFRDITGSKLKIDANSFSQKILICQDTLLKFYMHVFMSETIKRPRPDTLQFVYADTVWSNKKIAESGDDCHNKWEIAADGGVSFNSIPRFNSAAVHSQTDGAHVAATLAISRIFKPWFQAGISASYITLSYQDDIVYPGSVAGTYNTVTIGKPIIPVQLFAQANIGRQKGWQSNIALSAGYSFVSGGEIVNSGTTLALKPDTKGGLTAGFKLGIAYFFTCKFGLGLAVNGQYFDNKSTLRDYHLFALPITGGIKIRF